MNYDRDTLSHSSSVLLGFGPAVRIVLFVDALVFFVAVVANIEVWQALEHR